MIRQARTGDTVLAKSRETGRTQNPAVVAGGRRGKDDRKFGTGCSSNLVFLLPAYTCDTERRKSKREQGWQVTLTVKLRQGGVMELYKTTAKNIVVLLFLLPLRLFVPKVYTNIMTQNLFL
jgi:hypothetical protein